MQAIIHPSTLKGTVRAPASKSSMQRACAAALVAGRESIIRNPGQSNDDKAALQVIKTFGCEVTMDNGGLRIDSTNSFLKSSHPEPGEPLVVNCGESGLGIRMFVPILSVSGQQVFIDAEGSLRNRPLDFFYDILPQLEVKLDSRKGYFPLSIKGPMQVKNIMIDGSMSSQFLTGLLFAYSAAGAKDVAISVNDLTSKPYIDLTLKVMSDFGLDVPENKNYEEFYFPARTIGRANTRPVRYTVEGDWSGGAFLLVAAAISGNIVVQGLDIYSMQADKKILEALNDCGYQVLINDDEITVLHPTSAISGFNFDATDCPDLFPPLVALAAYCKGETKIKGVQRLTHKESNRALTLRDEFAKMGLPMVLKDDEMIIKGAGQLKGAAVYSHHDHRIAMACAVAALRAEGKTLIDEADATNKSYPDFYEHLKSLGAGISINHLINL